MSWSRQGKYNRCAGQIESQKNIRIDEGCEGSGGVEFISSATIIRTNPWKNS